MITGTVTSLTLYYRRAIATAFRYWSEVSPLTFRYTYGTPDIDIIFDKGKHGDGFPFRTRGQHHCSFSLFHRKKQGIG